MTDIEFWWFIHDVALRINFDDHKLFEETTNVFSIFGDYFYDISGSLRDCIWKTLSSVPKVEVSASWRSF